MTFLASAALLLTASSAFADPISYTEQAVLSGVLDGTSFTDALVTITATGDTTDINNSNLNLLINKPLTGTVTVAGIGSDSFKSLLEVVRDGTPVVGIALMSGAIMLSTSDANAFAHYELDTSFGPVTDDGIFNADLSYTTAMGSFILDETSPGDRLGSARTTFRADGPARRVPEPATLALMAAGLASFGALRRRNAGASCRLKK